MTEYLPGSVPYLREQLRRKMRQDYARAKVIRDLSMLNFEQWPTMTDLEKDVTLRQTVKAVGELAAMSMRMIRYGLDDLGDGE